MFVVCILIPILLFHSIFRILMISWKGCRVYFSICFRCTIASNDIQGFSFFVHFRWLSHDNLLCIDFFPI